MSHPRQDQKQSQFADTGSAECGGDTESSGDLFQDKEQTEAGAEGGFAGRELIEVAAEDLTQGLDTSRSPGGEVGEGAGFDFALVPEGLAEEDGWRRVTIGDGGDVHAYLIAQYKPSVKDIIYITCLHKTRRPKT